MFKIILFVCSCAFIATGCRTGRKATDAEETRTAFIKLNGLPDADKRPANLEFELSQCISATPGKLTQDTIQVSSPTLKKGSTCLLKGKSLSPLADDDFLAEVGVYYLAKDIAIKEVGGKLIATANIQTVYRKKVVGTPSVELTVPVQFPEAPKGQPVTATLTCNPGFVAAAKYNSTNELNGTFIFAAAFSEPKKKFSCTDIHVVTNGGAQVFRATFQPTIAFETAADLKITSPLVKLSKLETPTDDTVDSIFDTIFCPENEVFNEAANKCEPCPANKEFDTYTKECVDKKQN